jgi:thiopurine S-methyltransferase
MTHWQQRWQQRKIGWHKNTYNTRLLKFLPYLNLEAGDEVFVPLCGKSLDMRYLLEQGLKVLGVEISELAVKQFFTENNLEYTCIKQVNFLLFKGENINIYCGDYFDLSQAHLKNTKGVYDRAALIALPEQLRKRFASHLCVIMANDCRILLLTLNYPQSQMSGPPYSVSEIEVVSIYGKTFKHQQLECFDDLENESKFLDSGVDFIKKAVYCLEKE